MKSEFVIEQVPLKSVLRILRAQERKKELAEARRNSGKKPRRVISAIGK